MIDILLVSGSTRDASANTATLRTAATLAPPGSHAHLYEWLAELPAFNVDSEREPLHPVVADLRRQIADADAVLFCTPEYAGTLPGSLKNLLDWTVGGGEMYGKPAAWITVAAEGRGAGAADTLASVLRYVGATVVEAACLRSPVGRDAVAGDGTVAEPNTRVDVERALRAIVEHVSR